MVYIFVNEYKLKLHTSTFNAGLASPYMTYAMGEFLHPRKTIGYDNLVKPKLLHAMG